MDGKHKKLGHRNYYPIISQNAFCSFQIFKIEFLYVEIFGGKTVNETVNW